jgi:hypothetical protein
MCREGPRGRGAEGKESEGGASGSAPASSRSSAFTALASSSRLARSGGSDGRRREERDLLGQQDRVVRDAPEVLDYREQPRSRDARCAPVRPPVSGPPSPPGNRSPPAGTGARSADTGPRRGAPALPAPPRSPDVTPAIVPRTARTAPATSSSTDVPRSRTSRGCSLRSSSAFWPGMVWASIGQQRTPRTITVFAHAPHRALTTGVSALDGTSSRARREPVPENRR